MDIVTLRNLVRRLLVAKLGEDTDSDVLDSLVEDIAVRWYDDAVVRFDEGIQVGFESGFHM